MVILSGFITGFLLHQVMRRIQQPHLHYPNSSVVASHVHPSAPREPEATLTVGMRAVLVNQHSPGTCHVPPSALREPEATLTIGVRAFLVNPHSPGTQLAGLVGGSLGRQVEAASCCHLLCLYSMAHVLYS